MIYIHGYERPFRGRVMKHMQIDAIDQLDHLHGGQKVLRGHWRSPEMT